MAKKKLSKLIFCEPSLDVHWYLESNGDNVVIYGKQVESFSGDDADLNAAEEVGLCIRHALECVGAFDK